MQLSPLTKKQRLVKQTYFASVSTGWRIALHRYIPPRGPLPGQVPVLLCHGLGANRFNMDAPGRKSLAKYLCRLGFDCWVIELRGAGMSTRRGFRQRFQYDWRFEDHVLEDVPAALRLIRDQTGHEQVHWVGHSMGGMVAYAYAMLVGSHRLRSLVAIASPTFSHAAHPLIDLVTPIGRKLRHFPKVPYGGPSFLLAPVMPLFKETLGRILGNPRNLDTVEMMRLISLAPTDLPGTLLAQFSEWYEGRSFESSEVNMKYYDELERIDIPTYLLAGYVDRLSPPNDVSDVFKRIGAEDKKLQLFGKLTGCRYDYGHIDLVLGKWADEEVFPHIHNWLTSH